MANVKGGRPKGQPPKIAVLERENEIVKLRRGGLTWHDIGQRVGLTASGSADAFQRAQRRIIREDVEQLRAIENDRIDTAQAAIWAKVLQADLNAVNTLIRLLDRRAKLNGLDQPTRIQAEVITYDANSIEAELARIYAATLTSATDSKPPLQVGSEPSAPEPTTADN